MRPDNDFWFIQTRTVVRKPLVSIARGLSGYLLTYEELLRIRTLKLLTSDRDYVFFALQIDYPGKLILRLTLLPSAIAGN